MPQSFRVGEQAFSMGYDACVVLGASRNRSSFLFFQDIVIHGIEEVWAKFVSDLYRHRWTCPVGSPTANLILPSIWRAFGCGKRSRCAPEGRKTLVNFLLDRIDWPSFSYRYYKEGMTERNPGRK